jgi:hypothetical protein
MVKNLNRATLRLICFPFVLEVSDVFLLLGINRDNRYAFGLCRLALPVYVFNLSIPVGMGFGNPQRFLVCLQAIA